MPEERFKPIKLFQKGRVARPRGGDSTFVGHRYKGNYTLDEIRKFFFHISKKIKDMYPESTTIFAVIKNEGGNPPYITTKHVKPGERMIVDHKYEESLDTIFQFDIIYEVPVKYLKD